MCSVLCLRGLSAQTSKRRQNLSRTDSVSNACRRLLRYSPAQNIITLSLLFFKDSQAQRHTFWSVALYAAEVSVQLVLTVGEFLAPRLLTVFVLWKGDPLAPGDLTVDHESQRVQDVAFKCLETPGGAHRAQLNTALHNCCTDQPNIYTTNFLTVLIPSAGTNSWQKNLEQPSDKKDDRSSILVVLSLMSERNIGEAFAGLGFTRP